MKVALSAVRPRLVFLLWLGVWGRLLRHAALIVVHCHLTWAQYHHLSCDADSHDQHYRRSSSRLLLVKCNCLCAIISRFYTNDCISRWILLHIFMWCYDIICKAWVIFSNSCSSMHMFATLHSEYSRSLNVSLVSAIDKTVSVFLCFYFSISTDL